MKKPLYALQITFGVMYISTLFEDRLLALIIGIIFGIVFFMLTITNTYRELLK